MPSTSENHRSSELNEEHNQKLNENAPEVNMNEILSKISDAVKIVTSSCANADKNLDCDRTEKVDTSDDCKHSNTQTAPSEIQKSHKVENQNLIDSNAPKKPNQDESAGVDSENLTIEQIKQKIAMSAKKSSPKPSGVHRHLPQVITSVGPKKQLVLKPSKQKTFSFHDVEKLDSSNSKDSKIITDHFSNSSCSSENKLEALPEKGPTNFQNCLESNQIRSKSMSVENNAKGIDTTNLSLQNLSVTKNGKSWKSEINMCQDSFSQEDTELLLTRSLKQPKMASKFDINKCATNIKNQNSQKNKQKENHAEHKQKSEILLSSDDELPATQLIEPCTFSNEVINKVHCKSIGIKENSPETLIDLPMKHSNESVFHINTNSSTKKVIDKHYKMEQINADLKERHLKESKNKYAANTSSKKEIHLSETCTNDTDDLPATQIIETDFAHLHESRKKDKLMNISDNRSRKQLWGKMPPNALDKKQHASCDIKELNESEKDGLVADGTDDLPATQMMKEELAHTQSSHQTDKLMKSNDSGKRYQKQLNEKLRPTALNKRQHSSFDKNKLFDSKNDNLSMNDTDDLPATQMIENDIGHLQNSPQKIKFMKRINSGNRCPKQLYEKLPPNALSKKQHASCDKNKFNESEKSDLSSDDTDLPATQMVGNDITCLQNSHQKIKSVRRINSGNKCPKQLHEKFLFNALNKKQHATCDKNEWNEPENDLSVNDTDDLPATQMMETTHLQNSLQKIKLMKKNCSGDRSLKQISEKLPLNALSKKQHASFDENKLNECEKSDLSAEETDDLPATQMVENDMHLQNSRQKIKSMKMINSGNKCPKQLHEKFSFNALNKKQHATCNKNELNEYANDLSVNDTDDLPATQMMETTHLQNSLQKIKFMKKNYSGNSYQKQFSEMLPPNALNKQQHASCDKNDDILLNDTDDLPATQMIDVIKCNNQNKCGNKQKNGLKNVAASTIFKNKKQTAFIEKNSYNLGSPKLCRKNVDLPPSHVIKNLNLINQHNDGNKNNFKQSNNHDNLERKRDAHFFKSSKKKNTKSQNQFQDFDDELPATQAIDDEKQPSRQDHNESKKLEKCALLNENQNKLLRNFCEHKSKLKRTSKESKNILFTSQSTENIYSVPENINCDIKNSIVKEQNFSKKRKYLSDKLDDSSVYLHETQGKDVTKRTRTDIIDTFDAVCIKKEVVSPKNRFCNSETEDTGRDQYSVIKNNAVLTEIKKDPDAFENVHIKQEELEFNEVNDKSLSNQEGRENSNSPSNNVLNLDINIKEEPLSDDECTSSSFKKQRKFPNQGSSLLRDSKSENLTNPKMVKDSDKLVDRRQKNLNKNLVSDNPSLKCKKHSKNSSDSRIDVQNKIKSVFNNEMDVLPSIDLKSKPSIEKNKNKKKAAVKDISNNVVNKEYTKENVDSTKKAVVQKRHFEETETRNTKKHKISSSNEIVKSGPEAKKQKLLHYIEIKKSEKLPDNYTEVRKVGKKLDLKEEIAAEIKHILKPFYASGLITKENYKDIMRKAVPKVFVNCNKSIHPEKIKKLVLNYVSLLSCS